MIWLNRSEETATNAAWNAFANPPPFFAPFHRNVDIDWYWRKERRVVGGARCGRGKIFAYLGKIIDSLHFNLFQMRCLYLFEWLDELRKTGCRQPLGF